MEKLQGMHVQDAVLLESFGWAPGSVWWQRKMKVLERKKKTTTKSAKHSSCNIPVPVSWECLWSMGKNVFLQHHVSGGEF